MKLGMRVWALVACAVLLCAAFPLTAAAAFENTHQNSGNQPIDLVSVAKTQVGYKEGASNANKYGEAFGYPNAEWCGYFVAWCAKEAGIPAVVLPREGRASAYFDVGTFRARTSGYHPQTGDLILYGTVGSADHVGIVEWFDEATETVYVLDGNWSNQVSSHTASLSDSDVAGFVTPHYTSSLEEMEAFNIAAPTKIPLGGAHTLGGYLLSPHCIESVSVVITDENGAECLSQTAYPNASSYDLSEMDEAFRFGDLDVGMYAFTVTAKDTVKTKRWGYLFEVTVDESGFSLLNASYPTALSVGEKFSVKGKLASAEAMTKAEVRITDQSGNAVICASASPNSKRFDLASLDGDVAFNTLKAGTYIYTIYAATANGEKRWDFSFTVNGPQEMTITLDGATYPTKLSVGAVFSVKGTLTASETLTKAEVRITDQNGNVKIRATGTPNGKSYNLALLDNDVTFNTLKEGIYTYTIYAATANGEKQWDFSFTVGDPTVVTFTADGITYPTKLSVGAVFSVKGTVTASETLTKAEVRITDQNGNVKIRATGTPNGKSYNLALLDNDVTFNTLKEGIYTYTVYAATANGEKQWDFSFTVGDPIAIGDIDGNQKINTMDAVWLFYAASGAKELTAAGTAAADIDGNGKINMLDALALFAIVSG